MAIDTKQDRQSAVSLLVPSMIPGVVPDGSVERQAAVWVYSGISATSPAPVPVLVFFTMETFATPAFTGATFTAPALDTETFTVPAFDTETWND